MRIVTNREIKEIDKWAIKTLGIPGSVLMENAGRGCVNVIEEYFDPENLAALIICGKGNNGGDGFVIARHLQNRGAFVKVILTGRGTNLKGDAMLNYKLAKKARIEIHETTDITKIKKTLNSFNPDLIIDAIFGTGFKGPVEGFYDRLVNIINDTEKFVFSIDIPSGVNADDGQFQKTSVIADATATMCLPKRGNYLYPGRELCGDLYVVDIGIPYNLIDNGYPRVIQFEDVYHLMPPRPPDGNKGTFGNILIIAGARGFSGAAAMAAMSALKVGAGLVQLAAPKSIMNSLEAKLLEIVKVPLSETEHETISPGAIDDLLPHLEKADVVVIGPGITTNHETADFLFSFLPKITVPVVIDADAINIIAKKVGFLKKIHAPFILTPHPGELSRMIKLAPEQINSTRIDLASKLAKELSGVLVLKGAPTVIASLNDETYINPTGNSGLASAGSGDVLVGMISGFLAQNLSLIEASTIGVFIHGLCADLAMERSNEYSLTAEDLIDCIPDAINYIIRRKFVEDKSDD
ncbi:MAG: NAD(P)H-hydrate dehydratase [bacterium]